MTCSYSWSAIERHASQYGRTATHFSDQDIHFALLDRATTEQQEYHVLVWVDPYEDRHYWCGATNGYDSSGLTLELSEASRFASEQDADDDRGKAQRWTGKKLTIETEDM